MIDFASGSPPDKWHFKQVYCVFIRILYYIGNSLLYAYFSCHNHSVAKQSLYICCVYIIQKRINKIAKHKNLWFSIWSLQYRWLISIIFLDWFASINLNDTELDFLLHLKFCLAGQSLIIQTGWEIDAILDPVIIWMNWVLWFSLWCMHSLPWTNMLAGCGWELHAALRQGE